MHRHMGPALLAATVLAAGPASAASFSNFNPRVMGMGGAGVALADPQNGFYQNPAALAFGRAGRADSFAMNPELGAMVFDPDDLYPAVDDFQDAGLVDRLESSIDAIDALVGGFDPGAPPDAEVPDSYRAAAADVSALSAGLTTVSDKVAEGSLGGRLLVAFPGRGFALGVHAGNESHLSAVGRFRDGAFLSSLSADLTAFADCLDANLAAPGACDPTDPADLDVSLVDVGTGDLLDAGGGEFVPEEDLESTVEVRGLAITEAGLTLSRRFESLGALAIGLTPKLQRIDTFDYVAAVEDVDAGDFDADEHRNDTTTFNVDLGLARAWHNGFSLGLVVRNLIPRAFDTVRGNTVRIEPQFRAGAALEMGWLTLAADADLRENDPVGLEPGSRLLGLGAEVDAFGWVQLRAGVRYDTVVTERSTLSAGVGLSPFRGRLHLDLAASGSRNALGGAVRLGTRW